MSQAVPISLIIDDPPINSTYWLRRQPEEMGVAREPRGRFGTFVADWRRQEPSKIIPNEFWQKFIGWAAGAGVKGKFTFLPCPAGLGCVDDHVEGYTPNELSELLGLVREEYPAHFDITPEIWTHSMAWDMAARRLLPITEHEWMWEQDEDCLAAYMAGAARVLKNVGIIATGITQPCNYRGDQALYARAVLRAMKEVNGIRRTFYFIDTDGESLPVPCKVMIGGARADDLVVSVVSGIRADEPFWKSLYGDAGDVDEMAEYFISPDGAGGRLVDLLNSGGPVVFHAHGQTLFSNGTERGFRALQVVVERINAHLGGRVCWMTTRDVAEWTSRTAGD